MTEVDSFQPITGLKDNNDPITSVTGKVQRSRLITTIAVGVVGLAWKLFFLPISIIGGGVGLVTGSIWLSIWVSGCVLSFWLSLIGLTSSDRNGKPPSTSPDSVSVSTAAEESEAIDSLSVITSASGEEISLLRQFEGPSSPEEIVAELQSTVLEHTNNPPLMEEQDTPNGAAIETNQIERPSSPEEIVTELQSVLEENSPAFVATSVDSNDEHTNNPPLMEEKDTSYGDVLEIDQGNDIQMKEDGNGIETEAESDAKWYEDEDPLFQFVPEEEQEPDEIQVLVRLPIGERIGRIFPCTATLQAVYELVDSSGCLDVGSYSLVNFFPRVVYGQSQLSSTLEELGLHPQTTLFVELNS